MLARGHALELPGEHALAQKRLQTIESQIAELEKRIASWSGPKNTLDYACTKLNLQTAKELYEEVT